MVRKTVIAGLVAAALIATPLVAAAQTGPAVAGTPTMAAGTAAGPAALATDAVAVARLADPPGGSSGTTSPDASVKPAPARKHHPLAWLREGRVRLTGVVHAQWTTTSKDGSFVTHDAIHGQVSAVDTGAMTLTVTAADKVSQAYAPSDKTKVWKVTEVDGKRHIEKATLAAVTKDADVIVEGTGATAPYAATRILVQLAK